MTMRPALAWLLSTSALLSATAGLFSDATLAHDSRSQFSAGMPGDPNKPARVIKIDMKEEVKRMMFDPAQITLRKGEQIRFVGSTKAPKVMNSCLPRLLKTASTPNS